MTITHKILLVFCLLNVLACADIEELDLSEEQVILKAPVDGVISTQQSQTFWWEELEGASAYTLQIVSPSFDSIVQLVEQVEITEGSTYETTLNNGTYQWTVLGTNSVSESQIVAHNLTIQTDTTGNLQNQIVSLNFPTENSLLNTTEITFLWQHLAAAEEYRLQVASPDFSNSTFLVFDENTTEDFITMTLDEGNYRWRVRGENENSIGPYTTQSFTLDLTAPSIPTLISPEVGDTILPPEEFLWSVDQSSMMDTLYVYTDSLLSPPVFVIPTTATSYLYEDTSPGVYFWRLRSVDEAGNTGDFSETRRFTVE